MDEICKILFKRFQQFMSFYKQKQGFCDFFWKIGNFHYFLKWNKFAKLLFKKSQKFVSFFYLEIQVFNGILCFCEKLKKVLIICCG